MDDEADLGPIGNGIVCQTHEECGEGLVCRPPDSPYGYDPSPDNPLYVECLNIEGPNWSCGLCLPPGENGDSCLDSGGCLHGYECTDLCSSPFDEICTGLEGAPCDPEADCECIEGLACYAEQDGEGTCVDEDSIPRVCKPECGIKECGDDGCEGSCGDCEKGKKCSPGGFCIKCIPECEKKECGDDGCGGSCGACEEGQECPDGKCVALPGG